ncbi:hypothetical protein FWF89_00955 [Candidatus Saccharibacteria bacterium]|nr:hypothetical protein [Candidatus Saccharibacteria bacterium]
MDRKALRNEIDHTPDHFWRHDEYQNGVTYCDIPLDGPRYEIVNSVGYGENGPILVRGEVIFSEGGMGETFKRNYRKVLLEGQSGGWELTSVSVNFDSILFMFRNWGIPTESGWPVSIGCTMGITNDTNICINDTYFIRGYQGRPHLTERLSDRRRRFIKMSEGLDGQYWANITDYYVESHDCA